MSEFREGGSRLFPLILPIFLVVLGACGGNSQAPENASANQWRDSIKAQSCAQLNEGGDLWRGQRVKNTLSCLLASHKEHAFDQMLANIQHYPPERFAQSALWLSQHFHGTERIQILSLIENLPTEIGEMLSQPNNAVLFMDPRIGEVIQELQALLPLLTYQEGKLLLTLNPSYEGLTQFAPNFLELLKHIPAPLWEAELHRLIAMPSTERQLLVYHLELLFRAIAPDLRLQEIQGLFGKDVDCYKNPSYKTRSPFRLALEFLKEDQSNPLHYISNITQAYILWENTCHLDPRLGPDSALYLWDFVLKDNRFAEIAALANAGLGQNAQELEMISRLLLFSSGTGKSAEKNFLNTLQQSGFLAALFEALMNQTLVSFLQENLSTQTAPITYLLTHMPDFASFRKLPPQDLLNKTRHVEDLLRNARPSVALINEWQSWAQDLNGPLSLENLGHFIAKGELKEFTALLHLLADSEKTQVGKNTGPLFQPESSTVSTPIQKKPALLGSSLEIIHKCFALYRATDRMNSLVQAFQCFQSNGLSVPFSKEFLASPAVGPFNENWEPANPTFDFFRALAPLHPLDPENISQLWQPFLQTFSRFKLPMQALVQWFADFYTIHTDQSQALPLLNVFDKTLFTTNVGKLRQNLGIPGQLKLSAFNNPADLLVWQNWLKNEAPTFISNLLSSPSMLEAWPGLVRLSQQKHTVVYKNSSGKTESLTLSGMEVFDLLLWEAQIPILKNQVYSLVSEQLFKLKSSTDIYVFFGLFNKLLMGGQVLLKLASNVDEVLVKDQLRRLENSSALFDVLQKEISAADIFQLSQLLKNNLGESLTPEKRAVLFAGIHRLGVLSSLGSAIASESHFDKEFLGKKNILSLLEPELKLFAQNLCQSLSTQVQAPRIYWLAQLNQQLDAAPLEILLKAVFRFLRNTAQDPRMNPQIFAAQLKLFSAGLLQVGLPLIDEFQKFNYVPSPQEFALLLKAINLGVLDLPQDQKNAALWETFHASAFWVGAPGGKEYLQDASLPSGRTPLLNWLTEDFARRVFLWELLLDKKAP